MNISIAPVCADRVYLQQKIDVYAQRKRCSHAVICLACDERYKPIELKILQMSEAIQALVHDLKVCP